MHHRGLLTHYQTIPTFNKKKKSLKPAFSPFPTMFSNLPKTNFSFGDPFILSSANTQLGLVKTSCNLPLSQDVFVKH